MHPETARRQELERGLRLLWRGIDPAKVVEELSRRLTNKLMHTPTCALVRALGEAPPEQYDLRIVS